jgi:hypothetical protein
MKSFDPVSRFNRLKAVLFQNGFDVEPDGCFVVHNQRDSAGHFGLNPVIPVIGITANAAESAQSGESEGRKSGRTGGWPNV